MGKLGIEMNEGPPLVEVIKAQCERTKTLREMAERSRYFYEDIFLSEEMKTHFSVEIRPVLAQMCDRLKALSQWTKEAIHAALAETAEQHELKLGKLAQPLRIALTGGMVSPPIDMTIWLIGRERTIERLNRVI